MCNSINIGNPAPQKNFIEWLGFMGGTYRTIRIIKTLLYYSKLMHTTTKS